MKKVTKGAKQVKKVRTMFSMVLMVSILGGLFAVAIPVSAEAVDTEFYECVGTMTENFEGLADASALYRQSGDGVLSGSWQRSTRGTNGSASVADGTMRITAPDGASEWSTFSGVEFVFSEPLAPDYIVEVSYEMTGEGQGAVFFNNLSDANAARSDVNSIGAGWWDGGFQFLIMNAEQTTASGCWTWRGNDTSSVKAIYNLNNWTYDGIATIGEGKGQVTARTIGPAGYNDNGGTFVCTPGSTFDRLTFAIRQGMSAFDNISVKAYRFKSDVAPQMTETFTGKAAGAMTNTIVENGLGKWVAKTTQNDNVFQYAEYTNKNGEKDIGIKAIDTTTCLQYVPGVNFSKLYGNNCEITFGFDFVPPSSAPNWAWMVAEWGDGFTGKYRNIPFFSMIKMDTGKWLFCRPSRDVDGTGDDFATNFPFATLDSDKVYTFESKVYPSQEMVYASVKDGDKVVYSGFFRAMQWKAWTDGLNLHTMSITERWNATGIIYDNFKMSAKSFTQPLQLGKTIDFNEFANDGFLETIYWGAGAMYAPAPENGSINMGNALNVVGKAEGVALPYFAEPAKEGVYRYTAMLYNTNLNITDDSANKESSRSWVIIDAPKDPAGYIGSLTLAMLENNTVSLGKEDKIAVAPNEWVGVETIIDINNKKTYLSAYDKDGHKLGTVSADFFANDSTADQTYTIDSINSIRIRNCNNESSIASVIDDMKLEAFGGSIGFTKNGKTVTNLTEGDTLNVGFSLIDAPSADGDETCLVAFYDAQDRLLSVSMQNIPVKAGYGFCVSNDAVTVPGGADSAIAFVWHLADIKPLAQPVTLSKK